MNAASETDRILALITERTGLVVQDHDLLALDRLLSERKAAVGCGTTDAYGDVLARSAGVGGEFSGLVELLTVGHTRFFRNHKQFEALRDVIVPELTARRRASGMSTTLRVLSAGCSTGEEAYSLAMVLRDMAERGLVGGFDIVAVDISAEALAKARRGRYSRKTLWRLDAEWDERYVRRYCKREGDELVVGQVLRDHVEFVESSLLGYAPDRAFDVVFCRNVTIYFGDDAARDVLDRIGGWLADDGYLFAGEAESPGQRSSVFRAVRLDGCFAYSKASRPGETRASQVTQSRASKVTPRASRNTQSRSPEVARVSAPAVTPDLAADAARWLVEKDYDRAEQAARALLAADPRTPGAGELLARILANQGRFDEAEAACRAAMELDGLAAEPHFVMGLVHRHIAGNESALADLRRCVYLDPGHSLAYLAIAGISREMGMEREAQREYRNALRALEGQAADGTAGMHGAVPAPDRAQDSRRGSGRA